MKIQNISELFYAAAEKAGEKVVVTSFTLFLVAGPASFGALVGGAVGYTAAAVDFVTRLKSYDSIPEAADAAQNFMHVSSLATGAIGAAVCAGMALRNPIVSGMVRGLLGMKQLAAH